MSRELGITESQAVKLAHIMTVDVEDYFMVEAFSSSISRNAWNSWPSRVVANTHRALDLLEKYKITATFFFVGWIATKFPHLVRDVQARGHELACHSYWHRAIYSLSPAEFREDTQAAVKALEDAAGVQVKGYRAPSWSITKSCIWALDILAEEGFTYDSSIYPIHHDLYGVPSARRFSHDYITPKGQVLKEFPPATIRVLGQNLPGCGGGYLRILPLAYTRLVFRKFEETYGQRVVVYFHPWELDPEQPRVHDRLRSRVRHYSNLRGMTSRLEFLCKNYLFTIFDKLMNSPRSAIGIHASMEVQSQA